MTRCSGIAIALALSAVPALPQCALENTGTAGVWLQPKIFGGSCLGATGGFADPAGSFGALAASADGVTAGAEYGMRLRRVHLGLVKPIQPGNRLQMGVTLFAERYGYDQARDASLLVFSREIRQFRYFPADDVLRYTARRYGADVFLRLALRDGFSDVTLAYRYDVTGLKPLTGAASSYFGEIDYGGSHVGTSRITASYIRSTVDGSLRPTKGTYISVSAAIAGMGGSANLLEPAVGVKWFHRGAWKRQVIALQARAGMLTGYGGKAAPPFDRYYMGGEDELRGFASWSVSPISYIPGQAVIPVLNSNGSPAFWEVLSNGVLASVPATMTIPVYRPVSIGGDAKAIGNAEYRIPLWGPFTLALFADAGVNAAVFRDQLRASPNPLIFRPGSQGVRVSTGPELQALLPKIHVPLRAFWAYNPLACAGEFGACNTLGARYVAAESDFPNYATYSIALRVFGPVQVQEPRSVFGLAVGFAF